MDDAEEKAMQYVQRQIQETLAEHVGQHATKDNVERVHDAIEKLLSSFAKDKKIEIDVEVVGDMIRTKLKQPSLLQQILPVLRGPYITWQEFDGVTHVTGHLGHDAVHVRICDYQHILGGAACPDAPITCLLCLTMPEAM